MVRPSRIILAAAGCLAAVSVGVGAVASPSLPMTQTGMASDASAARLVCSDVLDAASSQLSLLSDAVPADLGSRVCDLARALEGASIDLG